MKAAVYYKTGPPDVFRYEDVADPVCGPGEVLVSSTVKALVAGSKVYEVTIEIKTLPPKQ